MSVSDWRGHGQEGLPTIATQQAKPRDESRQEYANARIAQFQRFGAKPVSFDDLLTLFRYYGEQYDDGARLRDDRLEGAA